MSSSAGVLSASELPWQPKFNPWLIGVVVAMAAFMEVLDTSIANVALPYMAGGLGSSNDESTWVLTSYLVSNAVVLPISGWLASLFGRKRFFIVCIFIFTVASVLCGSAASLNMLLLFRVIQGAGGGGLQPMAQALPLEVEVHVGRLEEGEAGAVVHAVEGVQDVCRAARFRLADVERGGERQAEEVLVERPRLLGIAAAIGGVVESPDHGRRPPEFGRSPRRLSRET